MPEFIESMWDEDDPDRERFRDLYWLEGQGVDVAAELDALRERRLAEAQAFETLTGVEWQAAPPEPTVVRYPTEEEHQDAYERAPVIKIDACTGEVVGYKPRQRTP